MKLLAALVLAAFVVLAGVSPAGAAIDLSSTSKLGVQNEFLYDNNHISGGNPTGSYLTPGDHFTENLGLLYNAKPKDIAWESAFDGRVSDDDRIEKRRYNVKRFYLKGETDTTSAVIGDFFASFSQYTLGKSLKGAQYSRRFGAATQVTVLAGIDKTDWNDLWMHNRSETVDRQVYGARVATPLFTDGTIGFNAVWSKDERARFDETDLAQDQRVFGVDWSLPTVHRLALSGESAFSKTQNDQPTTDLNGAPTSLHSDQHGWAHLVKSRYSVGRFKTNEEFERVSADYATTVGSASPDLLRVKTANTWTISGPWKWIVFDYTYFHNNLKRDDAVAITTTRMVESGLRYEAPDWRPDFSIESKIRHREATSSSNALRSRTRSIVSSVNDRFGPVSLSVDYEFQNEDKSDGSTGLRHHILGVGSSYMHNFASGWAVNEGLRWDLQRDRDNLLASTDQTGTVKANAGATSPWGVDAGASYSRSLVLNANNPGNDRRVWSATLGYNILKRLEHRIEARFRQNDNRFDSPNQDYKETVWEISLTNRL